MKMKVRRNFFEKTLDFLGWCIFTYWISRLYPLEKNKQLPSPQELQHNYTGHWWFVDVKKATQHIYSTCFQMQESTLWNHYAMIYLSERDLNFIKKFLPPSPVRCNLSVKVPFYTVSPLVIHLGQCIFPITYPNFWRSPNTRTYAHETYDSY